MSYARKIRSPIDGMYTWAIVDDNEQEHEIHKDYKQRYFISALNGPFKGTNPDQEHAAIRKLLAKGRAKS